ncbi:MAG: exodeoxyribonuclease III [Bacteriovoracaceae bacterium]|jgi:exodeoxyribonuclease-3|nr:exodeoxyribonuclease III [Bacteriovoracaceae bacterium]
MSKITLSTWNVNGIRASFGKGLEEYLEKDAPDILNLQEIKAKPEQVSLLLNEIEKKYLLFFHSAERPGYSGVMTFVKKELPFECHVENGLGNKDFDIEGRMQIVHTQKFILLGGYYPNGQRDHSRVDYKLSFSELALKKAQELDKKTGLPVFLCGDFNTAHREIDLKNPKANEKTTGFLPHERAFLDKMISNGFVDVYREKNPQQKDAYTWWTYRGDCRERNIGWRLDYFFANDVGYKKITDVRIRTDIQGSDHCPVEIDFKL